MSVSYTHLDVYKRQMLGNEINIMCKLNRNPIDRNKHLIISDKH